MKKGIITAPAALKMAVSCKKNVVRKTDNVDSVSLGRIALGDAIGLIHNRCGIMLKKSIMAVLLMAAALPLLSQEWEIATEDYYMYSGFINAVQNRDGDVVFNGAVGDTPETSNGCVMKVGQDGDVEFHVFPNDTIFCAFYDIVQLGNGNYFISGIYNYRDDPEMRKNPVAFLLDENLNPIKEHYIDVCGDTYLDYGERSKIAVDDEGNIIMIGDVLYDQTWSGNHWGCVLFKFSEDGEEIKRNFIIGDESIDRTSPARMLNVPNSDELLVLGRYQGYHGMLFFDSELNFLRGCKLCENHFSIWDKYSDIFVGDDRLVLFSDGEDLYPSYPYMNDTTCGRVCIVDFQGEPIDCHYIRPSVGRITLYDSNQLMSAVNDNVYYVLTAEEIRSCGPKYPLIYLMDTDLNVLGYKILPLIDSYDYPTGIVATKDGGCLLAMVYYDYENSSVHGHIIKFPVTDFDPTWSVGENEKAGVTSDVYPNPATNTLHLNIDEVATLSITDIQGRRLLKKSVSCGDNEIDISELNSGMYIYQVSGNNSENKTGKFIKK